MAEPTLEEVQAELAQVNKALLIKTAANVEIVADRDGLKTTLAGIEATAATEAEKRLKANGEFELIATNAQAQVETLTGKYTELEEKGLSLAAQIEGYKERDKAELATLLEKVPEALRGNITKDSIPLEDQLDLARNLAGKPAPGIGVRVPGEPVETTVKAQYDQAVKDGDVMAQISLQGKMHQKE